MTAQRGHLTDLPPGEQDAPRRRVTIVDLRAHRDAILAVGKRYGVSNVRVFGSVAQGEADEFSDLDLLIDVASGHGYFDMAGFALESRRTNGGFHSGGDAEWVEEADASSYPCGGGAAVRGDAQRVADMLEAAEKLEQQASIEGARAFRSG